MIDKGFSNHFLNSDVDDSWATHPALEVFNYEINMIADPKVKYFTKYILSKAETFWMAPVSDEPLQYPADEYEEGGLAKHTARTVFAFLLMEPVLECSPQEKDCAIAALLLRNVTKALRQQNEITYDPMYVYTVDAFVEYLIATTSQTGEDIGQFIGIDSDAVSLIMRLIHVSLGHHTPIPETFPATILEKAMFTADLVVSSSHLFVSQDDGKPEDPA